MSGAQHAQGTDRWFTPADVVERARETLGRIDLDPATEPEAQAVVAAKTWYGQGSPFGADGLLERWPDGVGVFCNPPGKKDPETGRSLVWAFWDRIMTERSLGRLRAAIWVAFSIEQLQQSQLRQLQAIRKGELAHPPMTDFPIVIPAKRVPFGLPTDERARRTAEQAAKRAASGKPSKGGEKPPGESPSHANAIVYIPGTECDVGRFAQAFRSLGAIVVPGNW